jgi:hypothetical protein
VTEIWTDFGGKTEVHQKKSIDFIGNLPSTLGISTS